LTELCRDLGVSWNVLNQWQETAMAGLLQALEPKAKLPSGQVPLSTRLQGLLERNLAKAERPLAPAVKMPQVKNAEAAVRLPAAETPRTKPEKTE
jgi:hypothetical protein